MAYSRIGMVIPNNASRVLDESVVKDWHRRKPSRLFYDKGATGDTEFLNDKAKLAEELGIVESAWEILHSASSGQSLDEQVLSVRNAYNGSEPVLYRLPEIRALVQNDLWCDLPAWDSATPVDQDHCKDCIREFVEDVVTSYEVQLAEVS